MATLPTQLVAEFIGTFLLVFTVGCNVLSETQVWAGVSIASVLMVVIYCFGDISGGNFNPAVSVALGIAKTMGCEKGKDWGDVAIFSVVQIAAGIFAGFLYYALFDRAFNLAPANGFHFASAATCELLYTFVLCFVVLNTAAIAKKNSFFGLAIGFVVVAGAYGAGAVSGGCFNPAVAIGIDVIGGNNLGIGWSAVYTIFELVGAALAAFLFRVVRPGEFRRPAQAYTKLVSEFLGTYVLVLTVGLNVLATSKAGAFSIAASLMCMIFALGDVSEAHFNPAVTLAIFASQKVLKAQPAKTATTVLSYMVAQILGGIAAAFTYVAIYSWESFPLGPSNGFGWAEVAIAEIVFTFVLCLVVLCVACSAETKDTNMFGLAIGSCITVGGFAIGSISGGSLNPAVSIGIASSRIWSPTEGFWAVVKQFGNALIYSAFEFAGAGLAAAVLSVTHKFDSNIPKAKPPMKSQLTAEFVGTFLLVFTIGCNVLSKTPVWAGVSIASVLMVMIYAFGGVSGANFNPAVSLTQLILHSHGRGGMPPKTVAMFSGVQILAGILAGFCYYAVFDNAFNLAPASGFTWVAAGTCELLYTFMLCFVILNVCAQPDDSSFPGLAIGFVIVAGAYGAGAVSGGCFNPAVALGIDVIGGANLSIGWSMIYIAFQVVGAALATGLFLFVRPTTTPPRLRNKLVSEFLGTFMLVLTVGLNVMANSPAAAFSIAASLMCMIYALGDVSGAHFNPAVTFAIFLTQGVKKDASEENKMEAKEYALFMVAQILGGIVAALIYMGIYKGKGFPLGPGIGFGWAEAAFAEIVFTFVLCLCVLCVAVKTSLKAYFGLAIGACVTVGGFAIGKVSGGSLNPAVSFGIAMSQFLNGGLMKAALYSCFELLGAALAAGVVMVTHKPDATPKAIEAVRAYGTLQA
mmetsp:Transcript_19877/g.32215  ORF Transcript_19877/g.32215 Transcript_19877/m.32215 type:complete len:915 (+) Transcript_19877:84-2828(+)